MADAPLIAGRDMGLTFGYTPLFRDVNFSILPHDRIALVGRNGCGKSTLLKILAGIYHIDHGDLFIQPGTTLAYLPQDPLFPAGCLTAFDYVMQGVPMKSSDSAHDPRHFLAESALDQLKIPPSMPLSSLSGGEARRIGLAHAIAQQADVLLLDEPTNHLDIATIGWLESFIADFHGAVITISHDRTFLRNISSKTFWMHNKEMYTLNKGFGHFDDWSDGILHQEERKLQKLNTQLAQEMIWLQQGVTARRRRNQGRLSRLMTMREERASRMKHQDKVSLGTLGHDLGSRLIAECDDISKSFPTPQGHKTFIRHFSTRILRGDRVGIIGPNGSGKSTLLKLLLGQITPDTGTVRLGPNISLGFFEQQHHDLDPKKDMWETLCTGGGDHVMVQGQARHVMGYLKDFLFTEKQVRTPISALSGGEKNRLALARLFAVQHNVLILDEPTNDLDMDTLDLLQDLLMDYEGTLILVSHDRDFLDRLVTSTIVMHGDGHPIEYAGGYSDYLIQRGDDKNSVMKPLAHRPKKQPTNPPKPSTSQIDPKSSRFGFKEKREWENILKQLEILSHEKESIESQMADPGMADHYETMVSLGMRHNDLCNDILRLEERWFVLEDMRTNAMAKNPQ